LYMFLGVEALDEEGLKQLRKRATPNENWKALEIARRLGFTVAINIIADPDWDERRFAVIREWALTVPEVVHLTVSTPYPGTETWLTESRELATADYRLFDVQHAVLPTRLPLRRFYEELVKTQSVINRKHLGWTALREVGFITFRLLMRGQTNFTKMLWKFNSVYNPDRQFADHQQPVAYEMRPPRLLAVKPTKADLSVHDPPPPVQPPPPPPPPAVDRGATSAQAPLRPGTTVAPASREKTAGAIRILVERLPPPRTTRSHSRSVSST